MKIYVDDGSTSIKVKWDGEEGVEKKIAVPTAFKRGWKADFGNSNIVNYDLDGEKYSFDRHDSTALNTNNIEWQYSAANTIAVHHALLKTGIEPKTIDIVVTLPLSEYYDTNKQVNKENVQRKKSSLMRRVSNSKETQMFKLDAITVRPESIPAGFEILSEMDINQSLLIVDIGGTTLDISQISGQMTDVINIYGDPHTGVSLITEEVKNALIEAKTYASNHMADLFIINRKNPDFFDKNINNPEKIQRVKETIESANRRLNERVIDAIRQFKGYSHVMVIGGGSELISQAIKDFCNVRHDRFFVSSHPQFDLVNGLFTMG